MSSKDNFLEYGQQLNIHITCTYVASHHKKLLITYRSIETCLHLHKIVEGLYFHYSLSECLSVKIPAEQMNRFGRGFC